MKYLLDTNICIYIIKRAPPSVIDKFHLLELGDIAISSVTIAELEYGASKSAHPLKNREALAKFTLPLEILNFDSAAARIYGEIRAELGRAGKIIGAMDMMIAAHALSSNAILITNNEKEFKRVKTLKIENWVA